MTDPKPPVQGQAVVPLDAIQDPQGEGPVFLPDGCADCPAAGGRLERMGLAEDGAWDYLVALAGNPNTGKSTVFNALTGLRQHTGNWPGKTVTRAEGGFRFRDKRYKIVDLPGTYSLLARSTDEEVARDFLLFGRPDVTIVVADASRLERNLNLVLQVLEITDRAVLCLNLIDEAKRHGVSVDERTLARDLGIPVVPTVARSRQGLPELLSAVHGVATGEIRCRPHRVQSTTQALDEAIRGLVAQLERTFPGLPNARWVALRLLDGDATIREEVERGTLGRTLAQPAEAG